MVLFFGTRTLLAALLAALVPPTLVYGEYRSEILVRPVLCVREREKDWRTTSQQLWGKDRSVISDDRSSRSRRAKWVRGCD